MEYYLKPIGVIRTPFKDKSDTPIQFSRSTAFGEIEVFPGYARCICHPILSALLDIKPYVPEFDICYPDKLGWYAKRAHL